MVSVHHEDIGPEKARAYLEFRDGQRPLSRQKVYELAHKMRAGRWQLSQDAIAFDEHGCLINGQHRLQAIVDTGLELPFLVVRGLPESAFAVMDQGKRRSGGDTLAILGIRNYNQAAMAAKILIAVRDGRQSFRFELGNDLLYNFGEKYLDLLDWSTHHALKVRSIMSEGVMSAVLFQGGMSFRSQAEEFAEKVGKGLGLTPTDPAYHLRRRMERERARARGRGLDAETAYSYTVSAWNAFVVGKPLRNLVPAKSLHVVGSKSPWAKGA